MADLHTKQATTTRETLDSYLWLTVADLHTKQATTTRETLSDSYVWLTVADLYTKQADLQLDPDCHARPAQLNTREVRAVAFYKLTYKLVAKTTNTNLDKETDRHSSPAHTEKKNNRKQAYFDQNWLDLIICSSNPLHSHFRPLPTEPLKPPNPHTNI